MCNTEDYDEKTTEGRNRENENFEGSYEDYSEDYNYQDLAVNFCTLMTEKIAVKDLIGELAILIHEYNEVTGIYKFPNCLLVKFKNGEEFRYIIEKVTAD